MLCFWMRLRENTNKSDTLKSTMTRILIGGICSEIRTNFVRWGVDIHFSIWTGIHRVPRLLQWKERKSRWLVGTTL